MYEPIKDTISSGVVVFKRLDHTETGGFTLDITGLTAGAIMKAGSLMSFDASTRMAKVVISGTVVETAADGATAYKIAKGSLFVVGSNFAATTGGKAYPITAIDASGADYDVVTVGTSIGAVTAGTAVFASSATGASAAAYGSTIKGLLCEDTKISKNVTVDIVTHGVVYARRIPGAPVDVRTALPLIIFSESY